MLDKPTAFWLFLFIDISKSARRGVKIVQFFTRNNFYKGHKVGNFIKTCQNTQSLKKPLYFFHRSWACFGWGLFGVEFFWKILLQLFSLVYVLFKNAWWQGDDKIIIFPIFTFRKRRFLYICRKSTISLVKTYVYEKYFC